MTDHSIDRVMISIMVVVFAIAISRNNNIVTRIEKKLDLIIEFEELGEVTAI